MAGGVAATELQSVTIQLDGTLIFVPGRDRWPLNPPGKCDLVPLQPNITVATVIAGQVNL